MNLQKSVLIVLAVFFLSAFLFGALQDRSAGKIENLVYSDFLMEVENGQILEVTIQGQNLFGRFDDGTPFTTVIPAGTDVVGQLIVKDVRVGAVNESRPGFLATLITSALPFLLIIAVWIFLMRRASGGGLSGISGFGKSKAKLLTEDKRQISFEDVAGIDEAKQELEEIVEFLRDPHQFTSLGGRIPKGVLLVGPPGTGKTLLARAIAGEARVPFLTISGSDFVEMFVGVGASRVRDMFEQAKKNAPCIVFVDEIDAVGRSRGAGLSGGHDEREQTLNQLLVEMDGFEATEGVILIAATNRPDVLDPALMRPGRFDRQVTVPNPDVVGREKILKVHMRDVEIGPNVDARVIARGTPGFSGADLANLVNEAALMAARKRRKFVGMAEFEAAKDKVLMGAERRSMAMTEEEKTLTAYHEAGHALVSLLVPGNDPLHKVTIIPRGRALGVTMNLPERDKYALRKSEIEARLAMTYGGRVAEELIFGSENVTTGASNDIQQATDLARRMVTEWGMSEALGRLRYSENEEQVFLGRSIGRSQNISDDTSRLIDGEVRQIVEVAEERAREALSSNLNALHLLAEALLTYETLSGHEVTAILDGNSINRSNDDRSDSNRPKTDAGEKSKGRRTDQVLGQPQLEPQA